MIRRRKNNSGSALIEVCVAMGIMLVAANFLVSNTRTALFLSSFSVQSALVDNFLENEAASIRSGTIAADGTITLPSPPSPSSISFSTTPATVATQITMGSTTLPVSVTTYYQPATTPSGQVGYQYFVQASFARSTPFGNGSQGSYLKARSVFKTLPQ